MHCMREGQALSLRAGRMIAPTAALSGTVGYEEAARAIAEILRAE